MQLSYFKFCFYTYDNLRSISSIENWDSTNARCWFAYSFYAPFARNRLKMARPVLKRVTGARGGARGFLNDTVSLLSRLTLIFILR